MATQMTRQEYEQKYGTAPRVLSPEARAVASEPERAASSPVGTDFLAGVAKSAIGLVQGAGQLGRGIQRNISQGVERVTGIQDFGMGNNSPFDEGTPAALDLEALVEADTPAQRAGKFAGDVATFAIPAGGALKATRGLGAARTIAGQSASDATVQSIQQGGFDRNTVDTAILGAVFPGAGMAARAAKLKIGPKAGERLVNSLVKPLLKDFAYGKNPGRAVAESSITANSLDELTTNIRAVRQQVGQEIGDAVATSKAMFDAGGALKPLDDAMKEAEKAPRTNAAIIARLQNLKDDIFGIANVDGQEIATRDLSNLTATQLFDLKREVGELTRWTGAASDDEIVNKALKRVYGDLKQKLDDAIDGIAPLNEKYANLKSAEIAAEYRDKIAARQNLVSLPGVNVGVGATLLGAIATGGAITPSLLIGATAVGVRKALSTPAAKTRVAAWLAATPPSELRGIWREAPWLRSTLQSVFFGEEEGVNGDAD